MKSSISAPRLGLTFTGCFLGAGYVSGREMWQFFGQYGPWGWVGLLLALAALGVLGGMFLRLVQRTGEDELGCLVIPWKIPALHRTVSVFTVVFLLGVVTIMTAGAGALFYQITGLPAWIFSLLFSAVVALLALAGLEGMVSLFSVIVPILTLSTFCISVAALVCLPAAAPAGAAKGNWLFSALTFGAYNIFSAIAILAPLGKKTTEGGVRRGIPIGTALLFVVAAPIILVLTRCPAAALAELPMLEAAARLSPALSYFYALLLLLGMLGTAFSCFMTGANKVLEAVKITRRGYPYVLGIFLAALGAWCASLLGFGELINLVYPVFGGISIFFLGCAVIHYIQLVRSGKKCTSPSEDLQAEIEEASLERVEQYENG